MVESHVSHIKHTTGARFTAWRQKYVPDYLFLLTISFILGILAGAGAFLLKRMIRWVSLPLMPYLGIDKPNLVLIIVPIIGIILSGVYQRYVLHSYINHGVDRIRDIIRDSDYNLKPSLMYSSLIASSLTLGFGGSAGSEGPIAYTGAAIGSNIGKLFRLKPEHIMIMIAIGGGAGIAGIFKAPVGGALFTIEVLGLTMRPVALASLFIACLTAGLTAYALDGFRPELFFSDKMQLDWSMTGAVLLLAFILGIYSAYYATVMKRCNSYWANMRNPWLRNILSGLVIGALIFLFPTLYGEGYGSVSELLADKPESMIQYTWMVNLFGSEAHASPALMLIAAGILLAKPFACSATNSGGGVAGDFAPTIMIGSVGGYLFAAISNYCFGASLPVADFVFLGTTAVMAGAIGAPLMAIFITVEMAAGYEFMLPASIVAAVSFLTQRLLTTKWRNFWENWYQSWNIVK